MVSDPDSLEEVILWFPYTQFGKFWNKEGTNDWLHSEHMQAFLHPRESSLFS